VKNEKTGAINRIPLKITIADTIMLKNISVRTFILIYLVGVFLIANVIVLFSANKLAVLISLNILFVLAFFLLFIYMTQFLVKPINTVKRSIAHLTAVAACSPGAGRLCGARRSPVEKRRKTR
jgi:hypothetical protein